MADGQKRFVVVSVGASAAAQLLAANTERKSAVILNNSAGIVTLGKDNTVTAANGLPLANGASISDNTSGDAWWAFNGQGGAADVRILETAEPA